MQIFFRLGLSLRQSRLCQVGAAGGEGHKVVGVFLVPVNFEGRVEILEFIAVPSIRHTLILGVDFFYAFNICLLTSNIIWHANDCVSPRSDEIFEVQALSSSQQSTLTSVIKEFEDLGRGPLGRTNLIQHHIDTGDAEPIYQRGYPTSPAVEERLVKEFRRIRDLGVIEPSQSAWRNPVVLVKKKNGKDRLCVDSRKLNTVTKRCRYALPYMSSILSRLGKAKFMSKVDLKDAFLQIPLSPQSKEKTAFNIPGHGTWQYVTMPFGLVNCTSSMQKLMDLLFGDCDEKVFVYLDDLIVVSESFDEHIRALSLVSKRLRDANLTVNYEKCQFCVSSIKYLGYVATSDSGISTDPDKVKIILDYPKPRNVTEMRRFMGMASYYRIFVPNFAALASPLHELTKGGKKTTQLNWTPEAEKNFLELKTKLVSAPILTSPDFTKTFYVQCDASHDSIGAVLTQPSVEDEKVHKPIAYASRKLQGAELNYHVTEKECLAVVFGLEKFRQYIEGYQFVVMTDHASLTWLFNQQNISGRLARWVLKLQHFDFELKYIRGKKNVVPDALSRIPESNLISLSSPINDPWYNNLLEQVNTGSRRARNFRIHDGKLFYESSYTKRSLEENAWKLVVPEEARPQALKECHDDLGHFGVCKTRNRMLSRYYWPGMLRQIASYIRNCTTCNMSKSPNTKPIGEMGSYREAKYPWQIISLDLMGPFPRSSAGNTHLLVVCDWFTKYCCLFPIRVASAKKVVDILENRIFLEYSVPEIVIADNGVQFVSHQFKDLLLKYGVSKTWFNCLYHPQSNFTERTNKTIGTAIRCYIGENHRNWDKHLPKIQLAIRTAVHAITGYSPFFLNNAREFVFHGTDYTLKKANTSACDKDPVNQRTDFLERFSEISDDICARMMKSYQRNKHAYDKDKVVREFEVGEKVFKRNFAQSSAEKYFSAKFAPRFIPCIIAAKHSPISYSLQDADTKKDLGRWHVRDIKPA